MPRNNLKNINRFLLPLSFLYEIGVRLRNQLFNWGILPSKRYDTPVISIGNLSVGGTGKTPHTEYIIRLLCGQYRIAVLSRGYKRKTKGFIQATAEHTSDEIGDEPYQMKRKFPSVIIAVDANRRRGIMHLLSLPKEERPEVILLDDAFQHRYVIPTFSILLTDYSRLFYEDTQLPAGRLREPIIAIRRADAVIVTKCKEDMKPIEYRVIEENMKLQAHQELYFTHIAYENILPLFPEKASARSLCQKDEILLLSGIASPVQFIREVEKHAGKVTTLVFPDHHAFDRQDIRKIQTAFDRMVSPHKWILMTEKDAARLLDHPLVPDEWKAFLYYLPIHIDFCNERREAFNQMIHKHITAVQQHKL